MRAHFPICNATYCNSFRVWQTEPGADQRYPADTSSLFPPDPQCLREAPLNSNAVAKAALGLFSLSGHPGPGGPGFAYFFLVEYKIILGG
jgi:hypothetical protein